MLSPIVAALRKILHSLLAGAAPSQLAAGFTLGMIIGLLPKGNLIAVSLCVLLFSLRVNKGLAMVAAILFSAIAPLIDPFSHKLGAAFLGMESLQNVYGAVFSIPLGPWLGFHNTVVTGSLILGLYIAYPVYWMCRRFCLKLTLAAEPFNVAPEAGLACDNAQSAPCSGIAA